MAIQDHIRCGSARRIKRINPAVGYDQVICLKILVAAFQERAVRFRKCLNEFPPNISDDPFREISFQRWNATEPGKLIKWHLTIKKCQQSRLMVSPEEHRFRVIELQFN